MNFYLGIYFGSRLGESCSHVEALLYKLEAAVRLGYTCSACTDVPCQWNQTFVKHVTAEPMARIKFYKETAKGKLANSLRPPKPPKRVATADSSSSWQHWRNTAAL